MKSKKNVWVGLFIIFLMASSTLGFIIGGDSTQKKGDFSFINGWWVLEEKGVSYRFSKLPEDLNNFEDLNLGTDVLVYIEDASQEQLSRLSYFFATNGVKYSIVGEGDCESGKPTLVIKEGLGKFYKEGSCFFFEDNIDNSIDIIGYDLVLK